MSYRNREAAGKRLAEALRYLEGKDTLVLALPRGGIVLGAEVALSLKAPLGVVLVRKIGHPYDAEYAIGAVAEGEKPIYNEREIAIIDAAWRQAAEASARRLIKQRHELYYGDDIRPPTAAGKVVILVDDGIATGLTMEAAVYAVRNQHPLRIIVAVPIAPPDSVATLEAIADEVVVLDDPDSFLGSVGSHYQEFEQVDDEEVRTLLREVQDEIRQKTSTRSSTA